MAKREVSVEACEGFSVGDDLLKISLAIAKSADKTSAKLLGYIIPSPNHTIAIVSNAYEIRSYLSASKKILHLLQEQGTRISDNKRLTYFEKDLTKATEKLAQLIVTLDEHILGNRFDISNENTTA